MSSLTCPQLTLLEKATLRMERRLMINRHALATLNLSAQMKAPVRIRLRMQRLAWKIPILPWPWKWCNRLARRNCSLPKVHTMKRWPLVTVTNPRHKITTTPKLGSLLGRRRSCLTPTPRRKSARVTSPKVSRLMKFTRSPRDVILSASSLWGLK